MDQDTQDMIEALKYFSAERTKRLQTQVNTSGHTNGSEPGPMTMPPDQLLDKSSKSLKNVAKTSHHDQNQY